MLNILVPMARQVRKKRFAWDPDHLRLEFVVSAVLGAFH